MHTNLQERLWTPGAPIGRGVIELFDAAHGTKQDEVPFENFVGPLMVEDSRRGFRLRFGTSWPGVEQDPAPFNPMTHLTLTSDASTEAPSTEKVPRGQLIGWANKTPFAGSSVLRGSVNTVESVKTPTYARWVFDWPTNAGNGTLRSLIWCAAFDETDQGFGGPPSLPAGGAGAALGSDLNYVPGSWGSWSTTALDASFEPLGASDALDKLKFWVASSNGNVFRFDFNLSANVNSASWNVDGSASNTHKFSAATLGTSALRGVAYQGGGSPGIWVVGDTDNQIRKRSATDGSAISNFTGPGGESGYRSIDFDGTHLWILSRTGVVYQVTTTGTVVQSWSPGGTPRCIARDPATGDLLIVDDPRTVRRFTETGTLFGSYFPERPSTSATNLAIGFVTQNGDSFLGILGGPTNGSDNAWLTKLETLGTRALLASDVTKSSLQTMKITYEFQFS